MPAVKTVVIAGATGFVGIALAKRLVGEFRVIGLTREDSQRLRREGIEWRYCDLFSLMQCERALEGADLACYLVHSMLPSARLTQGTFQDMDLIIADNFARAATRAGIRHIVYLGGLVPEAAELSSHLRSRLEVERALGSRGVPVTALRSGIVVGQGGSSYRMFKTLVERLPIIPCPRWADSLTQPVALPDVLDLVRYCLRHPSSRSRSCDIGSPDIMSYRELLRRTAAVLGLKRLFVRVPITGSTVCRYWLSWVTRSPMDLIVPLLESIRHPMVARDRGLQKEAGIPGLTFEEAVRRAVEEERGSIPDDPARPERSAQRRMARLKLRQDVRSVQRMRLPAGKNARWAAERFLRWLPQYFRFLFRAETAPGGHIRFVLGSAKLCLLELALAADRSGGSDRQVFYVVGGLLAKAESRKTRRARLEFRTVLGGQYLLAAIHDYRPSLPWRIYAATQATVHLRVMNSFARHLETY
ncbi:MAG TPA: NmrA family protein [Elusimicrobia bacterium]|nr:NmrA family protein [Elusimicrobiota bacterium]